MSLPFDEATFGRLNAEGYDEGTFPDTLEESVALISCLAGQGRVLEFAIGTGRMALPLAERGHEVAGIEGAPEMVAKLRQKPGGAVIEAARWDAVEQRLDMQRIHISASGTRLVPLAMRVAAPPKIDLMARLAGVTPEHRWGGWQREPFTAASPMHVSLYRKPAG